MHTERPGDWRGRIPRDLIFQNPHRADLATMQQPPRCSDQEGLLAPMTPRGFVHAAERRFYAPRGVPGGCPATKPSCKALDDVLSAQPSYPAAGH